MNTKHIFALAVMLIGLIFVSGCVSGPSETPPKESNENENLTAPTQCTPNWQCSDWSFCRSTDYWDPSTDNYYSVSTQNRSCTDLNNCGWIAPVQQNCTTSAVQYENYINSISLIYISEDVAQTLANEYDTNRNEFAFCLDGEPYNIDDKPYNAGFLINKVEREPRTYETSTQMMVQKCSFGVGWMHSHPGAGGSCSESGEDIEAAKTFELPIFAIACDSNQYTFYKLSGPSTPLEVRVLEEKCNTISGVESCTETFRRV
jgi:proteasome lid subunit RPN8/RPN11